MVRSKFKEWRFRWTWIFSLNLISPVFLGWVFTVDDGRIGMFLAIGLWWLWPYQLGKQSRRFAYAMLNGGTVVAVLQVVPILQLLAGGYGLQAAHQLGLTQADWDEPPSVDGVLGGFVATAVTGTLLQAAALIVGGLVELLFGWMSNRRSTSSGKPIKLFAAGGLFDRELDASTYGSRSN